MRERVLQTWRYFANARGDLQHAERTAAILRSLGADEEVVLAGLLHDRAKPEETRLWHRIAGVLVLRLTPRVRARLARGESIFARYLDHAHRGAELARAEGRSERVVRLIARHHEAPESEDDRLLARADREAIP